MKKIFLATCLLLALASCNNTKDAPKEEPKKEDAAKTADAELPFKLAKPYRGWQMMDNNANAAAAMKALKTFQSGDFTGMASTLGDSIEIRLDGMAGTFSRDSAISFFKSAAAQYNNLEITMYDYESVISADKSEEYVTMWYKQVWADGKGKKDSLNIVNDCKMKGGKMVELDEKIQHFPTKK